MPASFAYFWVLSVALIMIDFNLTATNLAVATIAHNLHITRLSTAQWVIDGYITGAATMMAFGGRVSDVYGPRRVFVVGLAMFASASMMVGLSPDTPILLLSRIIQGGCMAFTLPIALSIVRTLSQGRQQTFVIGLLLIIADVSQALGPTFGGLIIFYLSWRWIFFITAFMSAIACFVAYHFLPPLPPPKTHTKLPIKATLLLVLGLFSLMTFLNSLLQLPYTMDLVLLLFSIITLSWFALLEFRTPQPLLELRILLNRSFLIANIIRILINFIFFSIMFVVGLFLQNILGYTPLYTSYLLLVLTVSFLVTAIPANKLVSLFSPTPVMIAGFLLLLIGSVLSAIHIPEQPFHYLIITLFLTGVGVACLIPATAAAAVLSSLREKTGAAMGVFLTNAFLGASIGIAITDWVLSLHSTTILLHLMQQHTILLNNPEQLQTSIYTARGILPLNELAPAALSPENIKVLRALVEQAFIAGFSGVMWLYAGLAIVAMMLAYSLRRLKSPA